MDLVPRIPHGEGPRLDAGEEGSGGSVRRDLERERPGLTMTEGTRFVSPGGEGGGKVFPFRVGLLGDVEGAPAVLARRRKASVFPSF